MSMPDINKLPKRQSLYIERALGTFPSRIFGVDGP
jgi:hypothetical protein